MYNLELEELLRKYREQRLTREESNKLRDLILDSKNEELIKEVLLNDLNQVTSNHTDSKAVDFLTMYKNIADKINESDREKVLMPIVHDNRRLMQFIKVASVLILFFLGGGALSYFVFYHPVDQSFISFNEIKAPLGARSEIILPDGSTVWLNAGSKIKYLNVFNKENRYVSLEGEAYFKIAKNSKLPFHVKTGDLNIMAIGTEFNVKSYDDEAYIETTLVEGKVSIRQTGQNKRKSQTVYLEPHQKAVYVKENKNLSVEDLKAVRQAKPELLKLKKGIMYVADKVDTEPIIAWKDNKLILKGEELSNLLIKLERKYDVTFLYETDIIKQFRFTGTLENETLTQVLDVIKLSAPINYTLEGKTVNITENKQMSKKFSGHLKKK